MGACPGDCDDGWTGPQCQGNKDLLEGHVLFVIIFSVMYLQMFIIAFLLIGDL